MSPPLAMRDGGFEFCAARHRAGRIRRWRRATAGASRLAEGGGPAYGHLGHANLRSIMKYVHVQQHDIDREMVRLDNQAVLPAACPPIRAERGEQTGNPRNLLERPKPNEIKLLLGGAGRDRT